MVILLKYIKIDNYIIDLKKLNNYFENLFIA